MNAYKWYFCGNTPNDLNDNRLKSVGKFFAATAGVDGKAR